MLEVIPSGTPYENCEGGTLVQWGTLVIWDGGTLLFIGCVCVEEDEEMHLFLIKVNNWVKGLKE